MSQLWTKGRRCGKDGCRERYFRLQDGQRVCRQGHVLEGGAEVASDDDDFMSQGRRMDIGRGPQRAMVDMGNVKFVGKEGLALFMQCYQLLVRKQVEWVVQHQGAPAHLESVVKELFALFINETEFANKQSEHDDTDEEESGPELVNRRDDESDDDGATTTDEPGRQSSGSEQQQQQRQQPVALVHSALLVFLGCVLLRVPVYIYDLNRWIYRYQMPYMNAAQYIPLEMQRHLSPGHLAMFNPQTAPIDRVLHEEFMQLVRRFKVQYGLQIPAPMHQPLLLKVIHDLMVPPEIYIAVESLMKRINFTMSYDNNNNAFAGKVAAVKSPEVRLVCLACVAIRICFGLDGAVRGVSDDSPGVYQLDWDMWSDFLRKLWVEDESFYGTDESEVIDWDGDKQQRYLDWCARHVIQREAEIPAVKKRMTRLFPEARYDDRGVPQQVPPAGNSHQESMFEISVPGSVTDTLQAVHQTTTEYLADGTEMPPGADYQSFGTSDCDHLPPHITALYHAATRLSGVNFPTIVQCCNELETQIAQQTGSS